MDVANAVVEFNPKEVGNYGVALLKTVIMHEAARDNAEQELRQADEREKMIAFELTRTVLYLHEQNKIDLYKIYQQNNAETAKLYRSILVETGVLKRIVGDDDTITYEYTEETLKDFYNFTEELKEKDEAEYKKRRSRRNDLNIRLARVCKAAISLHDAQATSSDMEITKQDDEFVAVLKKGPKELMGTQDTVQIFSKSVPAVEGATVTPTITGLGKLADNKHKPVHTKTDVEKSSDATAKASSSDFTAVLNAAIMAIKSKEGTFSPQDKNLLKNLLTEVNKYVN